MWPSATWTHTENYYRRRGTGPTVSLRYKFQHARTRTHLREKHSRFQGFKCYSMQESISVSMATKLTQHCLSEVVIVFGRFFQVELFPSKHTDQFCFPQGKETNRRPGGLLIPQSAGLFAKVCSLMLTSS